MKNFFQSFAQSLRNLRPFRGKNSSETSPLIEENAPEEKLLPQETPVAPATKSNTSTLSLYLEIGGRKIQILLKTNTREGTCKGLGDASLTYNSTNNMWWRASFATQEDIANSNITKSILPIFCLLLFIVTTKSYSERVNNLKKAQTSINSEPVEGSPVNNENLEALPQNTIQNADDQRRKRISNSLDTVGTGIKLLAALVKALSMAGASSVILDQLIGVKNILAKSLTLTGNTLLSSITEGAKFLEITITNPYLRAAAALYNSLMRAFLFYVSIDYAPSHLLSGFLTVSVNSMTNESILLFQGNITWYGLLMFIGLLFNIIGSILYIYSNFRPIEQMLTPSAQQDQERKQIRTISSPDALSKPLITDKRAICGALWMTLVPLLSQAALVKDLCLLIPVPSLNLGMILGTIVVVILTTAIPFKSVYRANESTYVNQYHLDLWSRHPGRTKSSVVITPMENEEDALTFPAGIIYAPT